MLNLKSTCKAGFINIAREVDANDAERMAKYPLSTATINVNKMTVDDRYSCGVTIYPNSRIRDSKLKLTLNGVIESGDIL